MVDSTDGFELAEGDLEIRGDGALLGARQAGLADLRFARITHDRELLEQARAAARGAARGDDGTGGRSAAGRHRSASGRSSTTKPIGFDGLEKSSVELAALP